MNHKLISSIESIIIGTQTWSLKNLDIDDGSGGIYAYADNESNVPVYGRLYTFAAAVRVAALQTGWHLPSDTEWNTLISYLGGDSVAGGKMKEAGTTHWQSPNVAATNQSGFTALPGGLRDTFGSYDIYLTAFFASATVDGTTNFWTRVIYNSGAAIYRTSYSKTNRLSVRLIKD